jgi:hypothetical protein
MATPRTSRRPPWRRAWLFAALFGLLLLGSRLAGVAYAQEDASHQTVPSHALYLPTLPLPSDYTPAGCPRTSANQYAAIPIQGEPRSSLVVPQADPDLNLAVRGYISTTAALMLIDLGGDTDEDPPQLDGLVRPTRVPTFTAAAQVYDWDWDLPTTPPGLGGKGAPITTTAVTLLELATTPNEPLYVPARRTPILDNDYIALVLYAEEARLTIVYTRDDTPAYGYVIHFEDSCTDPNLLALYTVLDQAGRRTLPGLQRADSIGTVGLRPLKIAVRDSGSFMDPRSRKDWWCHTLDPCPQ